MDRAPARKKKLRLDLHYPNGSSDSAFLSHFIEGGKGKHRIVQVPETGVQVVDIWPKWTGGYDSRQPIAEVEVTTLTAILRNINAEVRVATSDGMSFTRLAKNHTLQIRLGDIISINDTLIEVHSARQRPQNFGLPPVDPRSMRLYSDEMDPEDVTQSAINRTVERYRVISGPQYESVVENVQPHPLTPAAVTTAAPSLFGNGTQSSSGKATRKNLAPQRTMSAENVLSGTVAEVESPEPCPFKANKAPSDFDDAQEVEEAADLGIKIMDETSSQTLRKLVADGLHVNGHRNPTLGTKLRTANLTPDRKSDGRELDEDAGTAMTTRLEANDVTTVITGTGLTSTADNTSNATHTTNREPRNRLDSSFSSTRHRSKVRESQVSPQASNTSTVDAESPDESGGLALVSTTDHSGETDLDEPAPSIPPKALDVATHDAALVPPEIPASVRKDTTIGNKKISALYTIDNSQESHSHQMQDKHDQDINHTKNQNSHTDSKHHEQVVSSKGRISNSSQKSLKRKRTDESSSASSTIEVYYSAAKGEALSTGPVRASSKSDDKMPTRATKTSKIAKIVTPTPSNQASKLALRRSTKASSNPDETHELFFSSSTAVEQEFGERLLKKLGVTRAPDVENCTAFIVGAGKGFKRTYRSLYAVALGKPILTDEWLRDAKSTGLLTSMNDCDQYWVQDPSNEEDWGTTIFLAVKRYKAGCKPFKDMSVRLSASLQAQINAENLASLRNLLHICGASKVILGNPKEPPSADTIFVGTEMKKDLALAAKFGCRIYSKELIPISVLKGNVDLTDPRFQLGAQELAADENGKDGKARKGPRKSVKGKKKRKI